MTQSQESVVTSKWLEGTNKKMKMKNYLKKKKLQYPTILELIGALSLFIRHQFLHCDLWEKLFVDFFTAIPWMATCGIGNKAEEAVLP